MNDKLVLNVIGFILCFLLFGAMFFGTVAVYETAQKTSTIIRTLP